MAVQNLVTVSHAVCEHVAGPKILGNAGARPCDGGVNDARNAPLSTRVTYRAEFGHSRSNHVFKMHISSNFFA